MLSRVYQEIDLTLSKYPAKDDITKEAILDAVYIQLCKDFAIDISDFGKPQDDHAWLTWLEQVLTKILERSPERFFQSLYRIDVPEGFVNSLMKGGQNSIESLAEIVLKRELLKVVLRLHYK